MRSKKKSLKESRLYVIIDRETLANRPLKDIASKIRKSGVDIVQLRDKASDKRAVLRNAIFLQRFFLETGSLFIINDYLDVAKIVDSDGIHLGQGDTPIHIARRILGKDKIIGVSCHSIKEALLAQKNGADYIGLGPVFPTATKPQYKAIGLDLIKKIRKGIKIPFFAIGDINFNNIDRVISAGADRVAVCRAVLKAKNIPDSIRKFKKILH